MPFCFVHNSSCGGFFLFVRVDGSGKPRHLPHLLYKAVYVLLDAELAKEHRAY